MLYLPFAQVQVQVHRNFFSLCTCRSPLRGSEVEGLPAESGHLSSVPETFFKGLRAFLRAQQRLDLNWRPQNQLPPPKKKKDEEIKMKCSIFKCVFQIYNLWSFSVFVHCTLAQPYSALLSLTGSQFWGAPWTECQFTTAIIIVPNYRSLDCRRKLEPQLETWPTLNMQIAHTQSGSEIQTPILCERVAIPPQLACCTWVIPHSQKLCHA